MNKKRGLAPVVIILIVVVIIAGGYFTYQSFFKPASLCWPYCPGMSDQDREVIKESALKAGTANWKTYNNEKYGFEFKYPSHRAVTISNQYIIYVGYDAKYLQGNDATYPFRIEKYPGTLEKFISAFENSGGLPEFNVILKSELFSIGSTTGKKLLTNNASDSPIYYIFINKDDSNLVISYRGKEEEEILSTFKFTK